MPEDEPTRGQEDTRTKGGRWGVIAALVLGAIVCWILYRWNQATIQQVSGLVAAVVIVVIPPLRRRAEDYFDRLRNLSPRGVRLWAWGIFFLTAAYLLLTATWQYRDFFPKWHDQQMTLLQAQMLARGRLWLPQHPCADFFETFYVLVKPVYAAIYFPGAALFFVPEIWAHLPFWVEPLIASGALAALLFLVVAELIDPAAGLLASVVLVSLWLFRLLSLWAMSHTVFALLALFAIWSWMRWRNGRSAVWAAGIGVALGWAAITRPVDAIAYGLPLGIAILWDLRGDSWARRIRTLALIFLCAIPFLSLQFILNKGVTGRFLETPFQYYYEDVEFVGISARGMPKPDAHATSSLPQKRLFGKYFVLETQREYATASLLSRLRTRVRTLLPGPAKSIESGDLPSPLLVLLLPAGLLALNDPRRLVVCAPAPLFIAGYMFYPLFLNHYCVTVMPGMIFCMLLGIVAIGNAWPKHRALITTTLSLIVLGLAVTSLPEFHMHEYDDSTWPVTTFNYDTLPAQVQTPALVLYRYWTQEDVGTERNFNDEPVYNLDVAWPDDAPIIRANDLGPRDAQIIEYYGRIQPERNVYIVARGELKLHLLGRAGELAERLKRGEDIRGIVPP